MRPAATPRSKEAEVEPRETTSATRPPKSTLAKRSRPRLSVPSRWSIEGARNRSIGAMAMGSGASKPAKPAPSTTSSTSRLPSNPSGSDSTRLSALWAGLAAAGLSAEVAADTGIEPGDHEICHEIDQDEEQGRHQHGAGDDG